MKTLDKPHKQKGTTKNSAQLFVAVKTKSGNMVSMRQVTPTEAKAIRNSAYQYLA